MFDIKNICFCILLALASYHEAESISPNQNKNSSPASPKTAKTKVKYFTTANGDIGYTKQAQIGGADGYHKFESFKKKDGDSYGYANKQGFGEEKKEMYQFKNQKTPQVHTQLHNYEVKEVNSEKPQKPPKGGYHGYAPIKDKFGKPTTTTTKQPAIHLAEAEAGNDNSHVEPNQQQKHEEEQPVEYDENDDSADGKQVLENTNDYDDAIDAKYANKDETDDNNDEDESGEKKDLAFNDEYKTIKTYLTNDGDDTNSDDYFSKGFDNYSNDEYKYKPFGDSEEHGDVRTNQHDGYDSDKQALEEYDEVDGDYEDDDSKGEYTANDDDSHFTYASEADTDASSS